MVPLTPMGSYSSASITSKNSKTGSFVPRLFLILLVLAANIFCEEQPKVEISSKSFKTRPLGLFYFPKSDNLLFLEKGNPSTVWRSVNGGKAWSKVDSIKDASITAIFPHPYDDHKAIAISNGTKHYATSDQGATWMDFTTLGPALKPQVPISFHASQQDYVIFFVMKDVKGESETEVLFDAYYTKKFFADPLKSLVKNVQTCSFGRMTKKLTQVAEDTVLCIKASSPSVNIQDKVSKLQLVSSTDFFETSNAIDFDQDGKPDGGVVGLLAKEKFMTVGVFFDKAMKELSLFSSLDGVKWNKTQIPMHASLSAQSYLLLDSAPSSLAISVQDSDSTDKATLFFSDSDGIYFKSSLPNVNMEISQRVDVERATGVPSLLLANLVSNPNEAKGSSDKKLQSRISFNNGGDWVPLTKPEKDCSGQPYLCINKKDCSLHLRGITSTKQVKNVISFPAAPGFLVGMGNVGKNLDTSDKWDVFVSRDGGASWICSKKSQHDFVIAGKGSILTLVPSSGETDTLFYSLDQGAHWHNQSLGIFLTPTLLETDPSGTSHAVLLSGNKRDGEFYLFRLDFSKAYPKKCTSDDFEKWAPTTCFMGQKPSYVRRKQQAECLVDTEFKAIDQTTEKCNCTKEDYECIYGFSIKENKCLDSPTKPNLDACKKAKTFIPDPVYRKIPGNLCSGGVDLTRQSPQQCPVPLEVRQKGSIQSVSKNLTSHVVGVFQFPDSDAYFFWTRDGELWSTISGGKSWINLLNDGSHRVIAHAFNASRAYVLTQSKTAYYAGDQGLTLTKMVFPQIPVATEPLKFHPGNPDHVLFLGDEKKVPDAFISTNNGTQWDPLAGSVKTCRFASTTEFTPSGDLVLCVQYQGEQLDLVKLDSNTKVATTLLRDVLDFEIAGAHLVVELKNHTFLAASADFEFSSVALPPGTRPKGQFIVHASASNLGDSHFMSLEREAAAEGELPTWGLYASNTNASQYYLSLPEVDVVPGNMPDFGQVQGISGVMIANQLLMINALDKHVVKSTISFNNGGSWSPLNVTGACAGCSLHVHALPSPGRHWAGFGGLNAAGRILAVGNVGLSRADYEDCETFASSDAGLTWEKVWHSETLYALGDSGNLMVLVDDEAPTKELHYSMDNGKSWLSYAFADEPIRATFLLAKKDATSLHFIIAGMSLTSDGVSHGVLFGVDFRPLYPSDCKKEDFEDWSFTGPDGSKCLLGLEISLPRIKPNSTCLIESPPKIQTHPKTCECTLQDFECDVGFVRLADGKCALIGQDPDQPKDCKPPAEYPSKSGYRRIPASSCSGGHDYTLPVNRTCKEIRGVTMHQHVFEADVAEYFYFKQSTILLLRTQDRKVWISRDEGFSFKPLLNSTVSMVHHTYIDNSAYFIGDNRTVHFTHNEGNTLSSFTIPLPPNTLGVPILSFHPTDNLRVIFTGQENCNSRFSTKCNAVAFVTEDSGTSWKRLAGYVKSCSFAQTLHFVMVPKERIFCQLYLDPSGSQRNLAEANSTLLYTDDHLATNHTALSSLHAFSIFYEFLVATQMTSSGLSLLVSKDGVTFWPALYPPGIQVSHYGFTVAESDTHSLILHVTSSAKNKREMGILMASNSNGTLFALSLDNVNRDANGMVDYEKMAGVEGVALANQVTNPSEVQAFGDPKKIISLITFNNGASWLPLTLSDKSHLHLHSFTERSDPENIFSIPAAVGMMIGVGNQGNVLGPYASSNTYFTSNAGKDWEMIQKGPHRHEFGDSGGIILLVPESSLTNKVLFSTDMGTSFQTLTLDSSMQAFTVKETAIEPQSTSQKLLVLGYTKAKKFVVTYIDFSGVQTRKCGEGDFESWSPSLSEDTCFFGHKTQYWRRKKEQKCYIDSHFQEPKKDVSNCTCTRQDFECDFNFILNKSGECELIPGLEPLKTSCAEGQASYTISTGYRKSPFTTCQGGELRYTPKEIWCPGRGMSKLAIFFVVIIPLAGLAFLLYAVIRRGYRRPIPWEYMFQLLVPCLCFIPAMILNCFDGQGSAIFARLRGTFNRGQGYEPVPQYDYDLDEDYIDGPVEVQLEDYDMDQNE